MRSARGMIGRALFSRPVFEFLQKRGIHLMRRHFYSPVPDTRDLEAKRLWDHDSAMPGVDMNLDGQLDFLERIVPRYRQEVDFPLERTGRPEEYFVTNGAFGFVSAAVLHCMIRRYTPRTIIEVGSGNSTKVAARAALMNAAQGSPARLLAIEPYPGAVLERGFPGLTQLLRQRVEEMDVAFFDQLGDGDILFIDSSHVVRMGGDVPFLYLEVLPRLRTGVVVHVHDIFFPRAYPRWTVEKGWFWNEQDLLRAFLIHNDRFEVLWCGSDMSARHPERLRAGLPPPAGLGAGANYLSSSFWMRRKS